MRAAREVGREVLGLGGEEALRERQRGMNEIVWKGERREKKEGNGR